MPITFSNTSGTGNFTLVNTNNSGRFAASIQTSVSPISASLVLDLDAATYTGLSANFNGSTQYLNIANNANLGLGTGDFTIEYWWRPTSNVRSDVVDLWGVGGGGANNATRLIFGSSVTGSSLGIWVDSTPTSIVYNAISGPTLSSLLNSWHHIALTRQSGSIKMWVDGTQAGSTYSAATLDFGTSMAMNIMGDHGVGTGDGSGNLTNVRVVKGVAVYTGTFTPPTSPLTAITNTQLLLNVTDSGTLVTDSSINNLTVTNTGSATYSSTTPLVNFAGIGITVTGGIRIIEDVIPYVAGLYKTTYAGYFADDVGFFATATPTTYGTNPATSVQTTAISEAGSDDGSNFSIQWLGYFLPATTETYTFFTASDDASYVWVGSNALTGFTTANAIVNNGGAHAVQEASGTISLTSGVYYPIRIQFGEAGGGDALTFNYSTPTITKTTNVTGRVFYNAATNGF